MAKLLLPHYTRFLNWVIRRLENLVNHPEDYLLPEELLGIQRLYLKGRDAVELAIAKHYPDIHPELVHLIVAKLDNQQGCLSYMDRAFAVLMR